MKKIPFYLLALWLSACNDSGQSINTANSDSSITKTEPGRKNNPANDASSSEAGCYRQVIKRDTILLELNQQGNAFTGNLTFDNFEKDASHGTVNGSMENGLIVLWYDFNSEGMKSVMEVIYKPTEEGLIRAVGLMDNRGDTTFFKNHKDLEFATSSGLLKKIDCGSR